MLCQQQHHSFSKNAIIKVVILQLESVWCQQSHNPLAYMIYIYSILSLQSIMKRFLKMAFFSLRAERGLPCFWPILVIKAKQDQSSCFFHSFYYVNDLLTNWEDWSHWTDKMGMNYMFRHPLRLFEKNLSRPHIWQQPWQCSPNLAQSHMRAVMRGFGPLCSMDLIPDSSIWIPW